MTGKFINKVLAYVFLFFVSPFILLIILCIIIDSPGPPILKIEKIDREGRKFCVYEFRKGKIINHPAIIQQLTKVGKLLNDLHIGRILTVYKITDR